MSPVAGPWQPSLPQVAEAVCGECFAVVGTLWRGSRTFRWLAEYHEPEGIRQERWLHRAEDVDPVDAFCRRCDAWTVVDVMHLLAVARGEERPHRTRSTGIAQVRAHRKYAVPN